MKIATILFLTYVIILIVAAKVIIKIGKVRDRKRSDELSYRMQYSFIQLELKDHGGRDLYRDFFQTQLLKLENMKYKNPEMTEVLRNEVNKSYEKTTN